MNLTPVTPKDIESLKLTRECPKPWCTRRFGTMKEVQSHVLWHERYEGGVIDSERLSAGIIVRARGPPEHRFFLVHWADGQSEWVLNKHFTHTCQHLIENYFPIHFYLDHASDLQVPWPEHRCAQCNQQCVGQEHLKLHVFNQHTFPARQGTRNYRRAHLKVQQRFQDSLPKVLMCNGHLLKNKHIAKWVGMTFTANGDEAVHVDDRILQGEIAFGKYRSIMRSSQLRRNTKVPIQECGVVTRHIWLRDSIPHGWAKQKVSHL